jgi:allantoin racemase
MKICRLAYKHIKPGETDAYNRLLGKTLSVCRPDTQVLFRNLPRGIDRVSDGAYSYFAFLNKREIVEAVMAAEKEGFDAVVVNSFSDMGVAEARSIVDIPVVSVSETSMMYATLLGEKFGILIPGDLPYLVPLFLSQIRERGLEGRVIQNPVRAFAMPIEDLMTRGWHEPERVTEQVTKAGQTLLKDGANVVICGSTTFGPLCTALGITSLGPDRAPLLDPLAIALKMAEVMVDFRMKIGLPFISRGWTYKLPAAEDRQRVRAIFGLE